jgi:hypothetical protein
VFKIFHVKFYGDVYGNSVSKFIQDTIILFVKVSKLRGKSKSVQKQEQGTRNKDDLMVQMTIES